MTAEPELSETFNKARMNRCLSVYQLVLNSSIKAKKLVFKVVTDEPCEGKTLEELGRMYFDVGVGGQLTALPFLDMLIVYKLILDHNASVAQGKGQPRQMQVVTKFSEDEAFAFFGSIARECGVTARNAPPAAG